MSKKPMEDLIYHLGPFKKNYAITTNLVDIIQEGQDTYVVMITDYLSLYVLRYNPNIKEKTFEHDEFKTIGGDGFIIAYGENNDITQFCDTVANIMVDTYGLYRPIHNADGFIMLARTREAIMSHNPNTSTPLGFDRFTKQRRTSKKVIIAAASIACINVDEDNPIPSTISSLMSIMFDSVNVLYKEAPRYFNAETRFRGKINHAMIEYVDFDIPSNVMTSVYQIFESLFYGYREDPKADKPDPTMWGSQYYPEYDF